MQRPPVGRNAGTLKPAVHARAQSPLQGLATYHPMSLTAQKLILLAVLEGLGVSLWLPWLFMEGFLVSIYRADTSISYSSVGVCCDLRKPQPRSHQIKSRKEDSKRSPQFLVDESF